MDTLPNRDELKLARNPMTIWVQLMWLSALSPIVLLLDFVMMSLHVRLSFGHWPLDAVDSFPTPLLGVHHSFFMVTVLGAAIAPFCLLPTFVIRRCPGICSLHRVVLPAVLAAGWVGLVVVTSSMPAWFVAWFLD
ncbi:MAG: hypothetical protein J0L84_17575 [Verrucomicrobia bacterium]|nr:hypothetical protein [Verrucomicrobiota bacterium]